MKKFELFTKLMMMTTSDRDPEALSALRKANAILKSEGMNWDEFLNQKVKFSNESVRGTSKPNGSTQPKAKRTAPPDAVHINEELTQMFVTLMQSVPTTDSFYDFIRSVSNFYKDNGWVTRKQYDAIKRSYDRAINTWDKV